MKWTNEVNEDVWECSGYWIEKDTNGFDANFEVFDGYSRCVAVEVETLKEAQEECKLDLESQIKRQTDQLNEGDE